MSTQDSSQVEREQSRRERAESLSYPADADPQGSACVTWLGESYFFGRHNSPSSYVEFGEWRRLLIETGSAPRVTDVRTDLSHAIPAAQFLGDTGNSLDREIEPNSKSPLGQAGITKLAIASVLLASVCFGAWLWAPFWQTVTEIDSTKAPSDVDGQRLFDTGIQVVPATRMPNASRDSDARLSRVAELAAQFLDMDPSDVKHYAFKDTD